MKATVDATFYSAEVQSIIPSAVAHEYAILSLTAVLAFSFFIQWTQTTWLQRVGRASSALGSQFALGSQSASGNQSALGSQSASGNQSALGSQSSLGSQFALAAFWMLLQRQRTK
ncbi:hypothetical protein EYF80_007002 [Liparis tanakae]|uniref:Uncharacterized protein n=1 Tax=Liparis tanakae TaxID=230148 RepID=A0A4Z2IYB5_9TELE|nr:hypothetical protein EYF80_007002 [Liparis tanakae]